MSHEVTVLVLDDTPTYLDEIVGRASAIWPRAKIERCQRVKEAIEKLSRTAVDIAILDLQMKNDDRTEWPQGVQHEEEIDLREGGGFIVFFSINTCRWGLLPPITILYTAQVDMKSQLAPFMYRGTESYLRGRPFLITKKDGTGANLEEALIDQECARYLAYAHKFYSLDDAVSALDAITADPYRNVRRWERLGELKVAPDILFRHAFPTMWHLVFNGWDNAETRSKALVEKIRALLAKRRWLPNLNVVLDRGEAGGQVVHRQGESCWAEFAERAKGLPQATRANLLRDLKAESWGAPPWASAPWAADGGYGRWCDETEFHFKAAWREWGVFGKEERRGEKTLTSKTLIQIVKERLDKDEDAAVEWAGAFSANGGRAASFYMDPYVLAEAVNSVFAGEVKKRAEGPPHAWLRAVYRRGATEREDTMALDLIGHGKKGFAQELRERVNDPSFSYRRLASELSGWCELWLYTHDEFDGESVLGLNVSNPPAGEQREWPEPEAGSIPWGEVSCVVRWLFRIPPVPEKKEQ